MNENKLRTIVITGGTGGIGYQSALELAKSGDRIVVTGRNKERGEAAVKAIAAASGNDEIHLALADLSTQSGVRSLAADLTTRFGKIDVLINNAGMMATEMKKTSDGFEIDFAVNVVAPYTLTHALAPALEAAKPARVLILSGGMGNGKIDLDNLQAEKGFFSMSTYIHSKRVMEAMSMALAREMEPHGIFVNVVYPGAASTAMTRAIRLKDMPWYMIPMYPLLKIMMREDGGKGAARAARSSIWCASAPETAAKSGQYFDTNCKPAEFHALAYDEAVQKVIIDTITSTLEPA